MLRENVIERTLRHAVALKGGWAIKLAGTSITGMPDRLVLLPLGRIWFVETKTATGVLSERQKYVGNCLRGLGFEVLIIRSTEEVDTFIRKTEHPTL